MNVYIDLGAYTGLYITRFKRSKYYTNDTKIYAFECNPHIKYIPQSGVEYIKKAAWIYDGKIDFYVSKNNPGFVQGSSVYKDKITGNLDKNHPLKIECIDFSQWIKTNFSTNDTIYVKMNIEGSEYDILEKMIKDDTINYINKIFVSWHWQRCLIEWSRHLSLLFQLKKYNKLNVCSLSDLKNVSK